MTRKRKILLGVLAVLLIAIVVLYEGDLPKEEVDAKYSSAASQFLDLPNGARVHYRDEGRADAQPVVLIHGSNASLHTWEPWVTQLGEQYRVITLDLPGHGLTGRVPDRDYSTAAYVTTINAVVSHLGVSQFVLGGNSMGGGVTWRYTLDHPSRVQAMILVDSVGLPRWAKETSKKSDDDDRSGPIVFRLLQHGWFRAIARYMDPTPMARQGLLSAFTNKEAVTEEMVQRYSELALREGSRQATMDRFALREKAWAQASDLSPLTLPTLVLWGRDDALIPVDYADRFKEALPQASVVIYDDVGHAPMEEIPDRSAKDVLEFLDGLAQPDVSAETNAGS